MSWSEARAADRPEMGEAGWWSLRRRLHARRTALILLAIPSLLELPALGAAPGVVPAATSTPPAIQVTSKPVVLPPSLPGRSPVEVFRELLAMPPLERHRAITNRPPDSQQRLLEKLKEYEALSPDERELRLQATELRWYLPPLMALPATNRTVRLQQVPTHLRDLVTARLRQWDILPPPLRQKLLDDDRTFRLYLQLESGTAEQQERVLRTLPPDRRKEVEAGFARWRGMSATEREQAVRRLGRYFDLSETDKQKVLASISVQERRAMEKTLRTFEKLPAPQRQRCIRSLEKLACLSPAEQVQFLQNAERWKAMTPAEREAFRNLVSHAPILPPVPPIPPLPSDAQSGRTSTARTN